MSFYVTLISDSSKRFFPHNKISHFTTQLPTPIDLKGEWEVGLVDFIYPHTWSNVTKGADYYQYKVDDKTSNRKIPVACYENPQDLVNQLNYTQHKNKMEFLYHPITKKIKLKTHNSINVTLNKELADVIGFEPGTYSGDVIGKNIVNLKEGFNLIYVYCDIVEPQIVADIHAPLLKIVKVDGKDGDTVNAHYVRPHYVPVCRQHFQTIEMSIRLHSGDLVPFERGRVIAVLHFRMKQMI